VPIDDEADQLLGPELMEATANEDVQSERTDPRIATSSAPAAELPTMSTQKAKENDVTSVIEPST
jgi:hypothetical protein